MKKIVKAIAFGKTVRELLKKENPQIQEYFGHMKTLKVKFVVTINMMPLYPIGLTLVALKWNISMLIK